MDNSNINQTNSININQENIPYVRNKLSSYNTSNPITISSDSDFSTQAQANGWPGNGSASNPYIIENLSIVNNTNNAIGIQISVFSTYFILRNNYIEMSGSGSNGIEIDMATNLGVIVNNTLFNNTVYGLYLNGSGGNTVKNNTIYSSHNTGIYISGADYNIIQNNTFVNNYNGLGTSTANYGLYDHNNFSSDTNFDFQVSGNFYLSNITNNVFSSSGNTIINFASGYSYNNSFSGNSFLNGNGIIFGSSMDFFSIFNNYFYNEYYGIQMTSAAPTNLQFYNNTFVSDTYAFDGQIGQNTVNNNTFSGDSYGFYLYGSSNGYFTNNTFSNGPNTGIALNSYSNNNVIVNNNFVNINTGIYFMDSGSSSNIFYGNNFINSSTANVIGASTTNKADNGSYGNFWLANMLTAVDANHDGIADQSYSPLGSAVITDNYPLMIWQNVKYPLQLVKSYSNTTYNADTTGPVQNITWKIVDESPDYYSIYQDGSLIQSGLWNSSELLSTPYPTTLGIYNFKLVANDSDGNVKSNSFYVTVADTSAPRITGNSSIIYKEGTTNHLISWNITDKFSDQYIVYKDGVVIESNTWTNSATITVNDTGLLKGSYNYTIFTNDSSGNINRFTTIVTVYDGTPPAVIDYGNVTIEAGLSLELNWIASDNYPAYYLIYNNGNLIVNNTWTSNNNISLIISTSNLGLFNFTIIVFDSSGNNATDTIFVSVVDTTPPVIIYSPGNETFSNSSTGRLLSWTANDLFPSDYVVYVNGSLFTGNSWLSGSVNLNLDNLNVGIYNITIAFNDTTGNVVTDVVWVSIIMDIVPPQIISTPGNISIEYGSIGNTLSWTAIDNLDPSNYTVLINGVMDTNGTWQNNTALTINIDGLYLGTSNLTIIFYDSAGNSVNSTISLTTYIKVVDTLPPIITGTNFYTFVFGSTGNSFSLNATDAHPSTYKMYINSTLMKSGTWYSYKLVVIDLDSLNLAVGYYNFTFVFSDTFGNVATYHVTVQVQNNSAPSSTTLSSLTSETTKQSSQNMDSSWNVLMLFVSLPLFIWSKKKRN